ncbi:MAG: translation initiation factor IF-2 [Candidatus Saccharibacteria bacterium]|nr:translation initiation factor IF-2 [Candidatus Saccharibacteria bacterium]
MSDTPETKVLKIVGTITVGDLAEKLALPVAKLVGELFKNGIVATVNQTLDFETVQIIVEELGIDVTLEKSEESEVREERTLTENATERPPIVAVMGHVDHGKTSLLDAILGIKVVDDEAGGITQHISAYQTVRKDRSITLLDTPGHEAFSALRQHGAVLTDVVIIVVAADDGVKPQTIEAIKFAQAANAKIVVAINKIDKVGADTNLVKTQLATEHKLNPEEWGGDTVMVEVSAKEGTNIDKLLDMVLLVSDIEELKAETDVPAEGLVIESHMEQGKGSVVRLLVEHGILKSGQYLVAGQAYGKIRTLLNFKGDTFSEAGPSTPATITGLKTLPQFGDMFTVVDSEKKARQKAANNKVEVDKKISSANVTGVDLLNMMHREAKTQTMNVVLKADVQGSLTSISDSLKLLNNDELTVKVVASGIGNVTENDIRTASSSGAIVYAFNVQLPPAIKRLANRDQIHVRMYKIIYELLDDAHNTLEEMLEPEVVETEVGKLEIKGVFKTSKTEIICGGEVKSGKVMPATFARVFRKKDQIAEVQVERVQRQQQEVKEVFEGEMCGLSLKTTSKLQLEEGDKLEFFTRELKKRKL